MSLYGVPRNVSIPTSCFTFSRSCWLPMITANGLKVVGAFQPELSPVALGKAVLQTSPCRPLPSCFSCTFGRLKLHARGVSPRRGSNRPCALPGLPVMVPFEPVTITCLIAMWLPFEVDTEVRSLRVEFSRSPCTCRCVRCRTKRSTRPIRQLHRLDCGCQRLPRCPLRMKQ